MSARHARESNYFQVLEQVGGNWQIRNVTLEDMLLRADSPSLFFVFVPANIFRSSRCESLRRNLFHRYAIPTLLWNDLYIRANGFSGCEDIYVKGSAKAHNTWIRFLVKKHIPDLCCSKQAYDWDEMTFFTTWNPPNRNAVFCFDTPSALQNKVQEALSSVDDNRWSFDPYSIHAVLIDAVLDVYNASVWSARDLIRNIEKNRTSSSDPKPNYPQIHDIARHAIHSSETLNVAIGTLNSLLRQHNEFLEERPIMAKGATTICIHKCTTRTLRLQLQMFQNLLLRSQSNRERLQNEITLAFNTVAQHDSRVAVDIGQAAKMDSAAMKTIAILTLAFLPATFVATIFGMSSFDYSDGAWSLSRKFWIYWTISGPLTVITVVFWLYFQQRYFKKIRQS
ncbi:hypothetical protein FOVG_15186 [Fusarium oxysporum f. sp. pisi HDV247]|uniref:Magnesium transport protein CorA n=1 Tax=Fusarium oxysporum f. sp. pisi HDV247 TaxID=1080344 RepID=W9P1P1_FUSOX|nr:hypothetical protein FOVG_15186 [Fusarium oxysporum f. sp. pisi HDV247]